jgi:hypothetical protein
MQSTAHHANILDENYGFLSPSSPGQAGLNLNDEVELD